MYFVICSFVCVVVFVVGGLMFVCNVVGGVVFVRDVVGMMWWFVGVYFFFEDGFVVLSLYVG